MSKQTMNLITEANKRHIQELVNKHYLEIRYNSIFNKYLNFKPVQSQFDGNVVSISNNPKPFGCKICSVSFQDGVQLMDHLRIEHEQVIMAETATDQELTHESRS